MFTHVYPSFAKGRILKKEMLENIRDYPRTFFDIQYESYSDGIIAGANVQVGDDHLTITRGIVKHKGRMYMLESEYSLPYYAIGTETVLKIRFIEEVVSPDFISYSTEIVLDDQLQIQHDERELGRFKLKKGARLRATYQDFDDFATEYNTINLIHVEHASFGNSTLSPVMLRYFATDMLKSGSSDPYDISFAMQCMKGETINRELLLHYLAIRMGIDYTDYSNVQIHKYLAYILADTKGGRRTKRVGGVPQRIIID
ncbi:DNA and RNA helicase [Aneurinibacillus uraniidurans]|uniref:DNA and RNA helicase n=1 Tax=Aneurinibacillus uraniidurans TaxID=2966586 RepID=UPI00234BF0B9|nr:DNA and RNA helicase [Aneurinibacillus sp. B1]WCN39722.1 DNA and RNA helicase [Aneurinibacillus sp. B1]